MSRDNADGAPIARNGRQPLGLYEINHRFHRANKNQLVALGERLARAYGNDRLALALDSGEIRAGEASPRYRLASLAWLILLGMVTLMAIMPDRVFVFALAGALGMILMRCTTGPKARASVDWQVLLVIGSSFGFAHAMEQTGLAQHIAAATLGWTGSIGPWGVLAGIYAMTAVFTSIITNNAAAALMFPIALAAAQEHGLAMTPVAVCLALAASAGFATPLGYQTNLMVMGPGGYKTTDFLRFGLPLTVLVGIVVVLCTPLIYGM